MKGNWRKMPSVKQKFPNPKPTEQYERPIGPERPTAMQRFESDHPVLSKAARKVGGAIKERSAGVAREMQGYSGPRQTPMAGMPADPFGMGKAGNPFGGAGMFPSSRNPFQGSPGPIHDTSRPPSRVASRTIYRPDGTVEVIHGGRSRPAKKRKPREDRGGGFGDPFHIPKSMRDMF